MQKSNIKNYLMEFPNFLSLLMFSFFMMLASPILMDMGEYFNVSPENMNLIITFFMIGEVAGILVLIFLNRKFNNKNIIILTYSLLIPTLAGLILIKSLVFFYTLYFISGFLLGIIFINANLSMLQGNVKNKESIINLGHGFFAIGALASPLLVSGLVNRQVDWRFIYLAVIFLAILSLVSYLITNKKVRSEVAQEKNKGHFSEIFSNRKKNIYMVLTAVLMLFYVMAEVTIFSWGPTFFRLEKLFNLYSAGLIVSVFWIGILAGRLIISVLSYKLKAGTLLLILSFISIAGLALAIFSNRQIINYLGAGLIGLGFSGIPPLLISSAGRIFASDRDVSLTILFVVGIISGSIIPFIIRFLAEFNFIFSMIIAIIFMIIFLIFVLIRKSFRKTL